MPLFDRSKLLVTLIDTVYVVLQLFPVLLQIPVEVLLVVGCESHMPKAPDWESVKDSFHILPPSSAHNISGLRLLTEGYEE